MPTVLRFDVGRLDRAKRTGAGGARVPASVSRTGVQTYTDQNGKVVREYRSPEEVFSPESLATLASVPITVGHPPGGVTPSNYRQVSVGHVSDVPPVRSSDGQHEWINVVGVISDAETLRRIDLPPDHKDALVEVSMGYLAEVVPESGVSPAGEHYDARQTNIRFNHKSLLSQGHARAGSGARLRLDGNQEPIQMFRADDNAPAAQTPAARLIKVDGVDMPYGSDTHVQMLERSITAQTKRADDTVSLLTAAQTELGTAKATIAAYKPVDVNALVQDELAFRSQVLPALPKAYDFTGKTRDAVRADAVGAVVMTDAAKLGSDAERAGYVAAHLKIKLDAASKAPVSLHVPSAIVDSNGNSTRNGAPKKKVDKRADAYAASIGASTGASTSAAGAAK